MRKRKQRAAALRVRSPESAKDAFSEQRQQEQNKQDKQEQDQQQKDEERQQEQQEREEEKEGHRVEHNEPDSGLIHGENNDGEHEEHNAAAAAAGDQNERKVPVLESRTFVFELASLQSAQTGNVTIVTRPEWAPFGVHRFHDLMEEDFYRDCRFFRVVNNFMVQFGINGDPQKQAERK
jgi:hypothetical protein